MATEMIQHSVEFRKYATRNLNDDVLIEHIQKIMNEVNEKVNSVWRADLLHEENSTRWFREIFINATGQGPRYYSVFIQLSGPNGVNADIQADELIAMMAKRGTIIKGEKWLIHSVDGTDYKPLTDDEKAMRLAERTGSLVTYADIKMPEDWKPYFGGLIGIDAQLRVIMKRVQRAIEFDFQHRFHGLLIGPPGCGKSTTLEALKRMFGDEAVMVLDGAAVTSSGIAKLIEELADLGRMPRFIFIEEIEKASNDDNDSSRIDGSARRDSEDHQQGQRRTRLSSGSLCYREQLGETTRYAEWRACFPLRTSNRLHPTFRRNDASDSHGELEACWTGHTQECFQVD